MGCFFGSGLDWIMGHFDGFSDQKLFIFPFNLKTLKIRESQIPLKKNYWWLWRMRILVGINGRMGRWMAANNPQ